MWENDLLPASSKLDTYFKETKRYVMSRRYQGVPKNQYYKENTSIRCVFLFYKNWRQKNGIICSLDLNESMSVYSTIKRKK